MESNVLIETLNNICKDIELDNVNKRFFDNDVKEFGTEGAIDYYLSILPSCREILDCGIHRHQTTSYIYKKAFLGIKYIFENYNTTYKLEDIVSKCLNEHNLNLEFEKLNPITVYKNIKKKTSRKKVKQEGDLFPDIPKVPKVKDQAKKIASLHFKVIPK